MKTLTFNLGLNNTIYSNEDVLYILKEKSEKDMSIQQDMTLMEISEIVSDKIIFLIKEQFEETKNEYEANENN